VASANEEVVTAIDGLTREARPSLSILDRVRAFYELGKPNLSALVVITAIIGFELGSPRGATTDWWRFVHLVVGTGLTAIGACALNMFLERDLDRLMRRTRTRPVPSGRISPKTALTFSLVVFAIGFVDLLAFVGGYPALLSLLTLVIYAFIYTPAKRIGPISIVVGAIPGAIPPVMGWSAVRDQIGVGGAVLFAILFFWQFPHFLALAWMYKDDYARAGFRFLPSRDSEGKITGRLIAAGCAVLIMASAMPAILGMAGRIYLLGSIACGLAFFIPCVRLAKGATHPRARSAFIASVTYLPLLLALMLLDRFAG
jgi:protoheme IX farnesyltransferase